MYGRLIRQGHRLNDIHGYTPAQLGLFIRDSLDYETSDNKKRIYQIWVGTHLNEKGLQKIIGKMQKAKPEEVSPAEIDQNWQKLMNLK